MTPDELKSICEKLMPMNPTEAHAWFEEMGIHYRYADMLRTMLNATKKRKEPADDKIKEKARRELLNGKHVKKVAENCGVAYETIYLWIRKYGWDECLKRDFWTERKIMTLCSQMKKKTKFEEIARMLGASIMQVRTMSTRIRTRTHVNKWIPVIEKYGF